MILLLEVVVDMARVAGSIETIVVAKSRSDNSILQGKRGVMWMWMWLLVIA